MLTLDRLRLDLDGFALTADWALPPEGHLALIGPSGAGKTSLLLAIAGFIAPAGGRILWQGRDLRGAAPGDRPVSILFQDQNLFPHLTLTQNLALGLAPDGRLPPEGLDRIAAALESVGLPGLGARRPAQLSGGQQGRAALARALLRARPLLLLDEPFAALGPALRAEMLALVQAVAAQSGARVILVSHDPRDVAGFAAQTVLVAEGIAHPPRPTGALLADPPPALRAYLG